MKGDRRDRGEQSVIRAQDACVSLFSRSGRLMSVRTWRFLGISLGEKERGANGKLDVLPKDGCGCARGGSCENSLNGVNES